MVRLKLNPRWSDTVNKVLDRGDTLFENLDAIETVQQDGFLGEHPHWGTLGQYDSWRPAILLRADHPGDTVHTILHELGHHLHYLRIYGHPRERGDTREEWSDWFFSTGRDASPIEDGFDAEYVADTFADWHTGDIEEVGTLYHDLEGPALDEPIATDL